MTERIWPERDLSWQAAYLWAVTRPEVSSEAIAARLDELRDAVLEAGVPAEELFGDPAALAADDAAELGSEEEAVRSSFGSGAKHTLLLIGVILLMPVIPLLIVLLISTGWEIDLTARALAFSGCLALLLASCAVIRALHDAGRPKGVVAMIAVAALLLVAAVAVAMTTDSLPLLAHDVPTLLVGLGAAVPGAALLLISSLLPDAPLREEWSDEQWTRRFRAALLSRGLSRHQAAERVRELQTDRGATAGSAFEEYGHPVAFARRLTEHAPDAKKRRWMAGGAAELLVPALMLVIGATSTDFWWWVRVLMVGIGAAWLVLNARSVWGSRPWKAAE